MTPAGSVPCPEAGAAAPSHLVGPRTTVTEREPTASSTAVWWSDSRSRHAAGETFAD